MQIVFNGQQYKVSALAALTGFGHKETLDTKDLHVVQGSDYECKYPVVYKHDGKIYVLAGKVDFTNEKTQVVIISKHILKKSLMSVQSQPIVIDTRIEQTQPNKFRNINYKGNDSYSVKDRKNTDESSKAKRALSILQNTISR